MSFTTENKNSTHESQIVTTVPVGTTNPDWVKLDQFLSNYSKDSDVSTLEFNYVDLSDPKQYNMETLAKDGRIFNQQVVFDVMENPKMSFTTSLWRKTEIRNQDLLREHLFKFVREYELVSFSSLFY